MVMVDIESNKSTKFIKPIKNLEYYLRSKFLINHSFHELSTKKYQYKLSYRNVLVWSMYVIHAIKYGLHFLTFNKPQLSAMIGHLMRPIGITGTVVVFGQSLFASWCSLMMYVLMKNQAAKNLTVLADFDMFINEDINDIYIVNGTATIGRTKLWPQNYSKFAFHAKIAMIFPPLLGYLWPFFVVPMGVLGTWSGYSHDGNHQLALYRCLWVVLLFIFIWYYGWFFSLQLVMFYLSSLYLNLRFEQLRSELTTHMDGAGGGIVPSTKLDDFLNRFNALCNRVHEYNRTYKYLLCCMTFCGMGIFTGCFILLMPKYENPIEKYVKWPLYVGSVEAMFGISFFASVAGNVHWNSKCFYPLLNTILVRSIKTVKGRKVSTASVYSVESSYSSDKIIVDDGTEFNVYPRSLQVKLRSLIFRLSSDRCPVSFFNYDLYPFTHIAYANMIVGTFGTILLAIGLVLKFKTI